MYLKLIFEIPLMYLSIHFTALQCFLMSLLMYQHTSPTANAKSGRVPIYEYMKLQLHFDKVLSSSLHSDLFLQYQ